MMRDCTRCRQPFTAADLVREESRNLEAKRKEAGLTGIRFLYYRCRGCGTNNIFVDILPLPEELPDLFNKRRDEMEAVVRQLHADKTEAVVVAVPRR